MLEENSLPVPTIPLWLASSRVLTPIYHHPQNSLMNRLLIFPLLELFGEEAIYSSRGNVCPMVCVILPDKSLYTREDHLLIKITLQEQEPRQLEAIWKTTTDPRLRTRCQAVLMAARGRRHHHLAEDVGGTSRTLQRWLNPSKEPGLTSLQI